MFGFKRQDACAIRFLCAPQDESVIAPPAPAKAHLPDWFRKLPPVDKARQGPSDNGLTIKRCMPFLDAMATGWILPLAATVRLEIGDNGARVDAGWEFDRVMVSNHGAHQVAGNPREPSPPCKFHNYWSIRTPPGWSCLFLAPLNRDPQPFQCVAGLVDTDTYHAHIHFPFFATAPDGLYTIEKGTPLVQVIPIRRDAAVSAEIRAERPNEGLATERMRRQTLWREAFELVRALDLLAQRDVGVVNMSLSGPANALLEQAVSRATARGAVVVAAAGNKGPRADPLYPAAYDGVVAVTAVDRAKRVYRRAGRGAHIDFAAPGLEVWTAASIQGGRPKTGTSFAAPFVAAAAALALGGDGDGAGDVEERLAGAAEDLGAPGRDPVYGWGLLNARALCDGFRTAVGGEAEVAPASLPAQ